MAEMPLGTIIIWPNDPIPHCWLRPTQEGVMLKKEDYPELYRILGEAYGPQTEEEFKVGPIRADMIIKVKSNV
jgi:microcystin-dependent protein